MFGSNEVIKIKIITVLAEKRVERELKTRRLTDTEQEALYLETFNNLQEILREID